MMTDIDCSICHDCGEKMYPNLGSAVLPDGSLPFHPCLNCTRSVEKGEEVKKIKKTKLPCFMKIIENSSLRLSRRIFCALSSKKVIIKSNSIDSPKKTVVSSKPAILTESTLHPLPIFTKKRRCKLLEIAYIEDPETKKMIPIRQCKCDKCKNKTISELAMSLDY
tara:strand:- start:697 stop:1191 length:495 start_codon:yes stop_codon:yes gene_type:complete